MFAGTQREYPLAAMVREHLVWHSGKPSRRTAARRGNRYHFSPADFSWGPASGGLQVGINVPPITYDIEKQNSDVQRLVVAIRNVGTRAVVLPMNGSHVAGWPCDWPNQPTSSCR